MAEPTSAVTRYALVDNTMTVLEEKRKSAIPKKPSKTQNGVSSNGMIGLNLEILTKMKKFLSYNCNSKRKIRLFYGTFCYRNTKERRIWIYMYFHNTSPPSGWTYASSEESWCKKLHFPRWRIWQILQNQWNEKDQKHWRWNKKGTSWNYINYKIII